MKKYMVLLFIIAILFVSFVWGGNAPALQEIPDQNTKSEEVVEAVVQSPEKQENVVEKIPEPSIVSETKQSPKQNETDQPASKELTCTLTIRCDTILDNIEWLQPEKHNYVPENGVIYSKNGIVFNDGDSVFDILLKTLQADKLHIEFVKTPVYDSVYIEGINNLYEFDCGELSGWMYKVNQVFPNYGCTLHKVKNGDIIEFVYTCDLGRDVGGDYFAQRNN